MISLTKKIFQEENREVFLSSQMHFLDLKYLTEREREREILVVTMFLV